MARHVSAVDGVVEARVSYALEDARIRFDPAKVAPARLLEAIGEAGYQVRPEHAEDREADEQAGLRGLDSGAPIEAVVTAHPDHHRQIWLTRIGVSDLRTEPR